MTLKDLYWQNDKIPASKRHGDIYFSSDNGLQESRHVFLKGIYAAKIWPKTDQFTLLENGFGTGLNFAMTCHEWLKIARPHAHLTYIATEKYPLAKDDIDRALSNWPELEQEKQALLEIYPFPCSGFHPRELFGGRIKLILLIGDSAHCLKQLDSKVDAFYLDGFAPKRNPDMWSDEIFAELARLAAPQAQIATFTSAGFVRRGLETKGFKMKKMAGFGKKRESLQGKYNGPLNPDPKPWYHRPEPLAKGASIAIIGGGIAGLTAGSALQKQGYKVTIFERDNCPMNQASGNPAGIIDPYLTIGQGVEGNFHRAALIYAIAYYHDLDPEILLIRGLTKFPINKVEKEKFSKFLAQAELPVEFMSEGPDGELYFPKCGAISPPKIRENLAQKLLIKNAANITSIEYDGKWTLFKGGKACFRADAIVICGGPASSSFPETSPLPLDPVRGQITLLDAENIQKPPNQVICGKGYIIPPLAIEGRLTIVTGASFSRNDTDITLRTEDHEENLHNAERLWPSLSGAKNVIGGRCAIRAYSPDHMPLCGPVPDYGQYRTAYELLKHGAQHKTFARAPYQPNLYVMSGLGARGFIAAPLLADYLSALISGNTLPVSRPVYESLHPARFLIRSLIKGQ